MAEFTVSGRFEEVSGEPMTVARAPQVYFRPVESSVIGGAFVPSKEVAADLNEDGTFTVPLVGDASTRYKVTARWLAADADPEVAAYGYAEIPGEVKLYPGGDLATLIPPSTNAVEQSLIDMGAMLSSRGVISTVTDLDEMRTRAWAGYWAARAENLLNLPPVGSDSTVWMISVEPSSPQSTRQRLDAADPEIKGTWKRESLHASAFGPWEYLPEVEEVLPRSRGVISTVTDLDEMRTTEWAGSWSALGQNLLNTPPVGGETTVWMITVEISSPQSIRQRLDAAGSIVQGTWKRETQLNLEFGPWVYMPTAEEASATRGVISTPTDMDVMRTPEWAGYWSAQGRNLLNKPPAGGDSTVWMLSVEISSVNSIRQRLDVAGSSIKGTWKRETAPNLEFGPWQYMPEASEIGAFIDPASVVGLTPATPNGYKTVGISCSVGRALSLITGEGYARLLQTMPETATRVRVRISNRNPRFEMPDGDAMTLNNVAIGVRDSASPDTSTSWVTIASSASTGTDGYVSPWITVPANMKGEDILLAYGWKCTGDVPLDLATSYLGDTAADVLTGTGTRGGHAPGYATLEVEVPSTTRTVAAFGDSISTGFGSTGAIYFSWVTQWAKANDAVPMHWAAGGDAVSAWQNPASSKWNLYGLNIAPADAVIYAMGSNDIFVSTPPTLAELQEHTRVAVETMRRMISPNVYGATITPRTSTTGAAESLRREYNAWLPVSGLFRDVFDMSAAISNDDETIRPEFDADGVHPNNAGYEAMTAAINRPIIA